MSFFDRLFFVVAVWFATRKDVPERFRLSDDPDERPNFTYFRFKENDDTASYDFLAKKLVRGHGVEGIMLPESQGEFYEACIGFNCIRKPTFNIERFYRIVSIQYISPVAYLWGELTRKHVREYRTEKHTQAEFNKSFEFRSDRMQVLSDIVEAYQERWRDDRISPFAEYTFGGIEIFSETVSDKVWGHPDHQMYLGQFVLVLDSLVSSGDLSKVGSDYRLEGKALQTLSKYAEEERRHKDFDNHNKSIRYLTLLLIAVTFLGLLASLID